jgi:hypothetical protein
MIMDHKARVATFFDIGSIGEGEERLKTYGIGALGNFSLLGANMSLLGQISFNKTDYLNTQRILVGAGRYGDKTTFTLSAKLDEGTFSPPGMEKDATMKDYTISARFTFTP